MSTTVPPASETIPTGARAERASRSERHKEVREKVRAESVREIPKWYSPFGHLLATTGVGAATMAFALSRLTKPSWVELVAVPAASFVVANAFEWRVHKKLLHKRTWPFEELFDRHTPVHHVVFVEDDMSIRESKEMRLVLIPAIGVLGAVIASAPGAALAGALFGKNVGLLALATSGAYMVAYELSHLAYHLPEDHPVGGHPLVRFMRKHHAAHHDPKRMQRENFNVTVPLFDWIMGTMAKDEPAPAEASEELASAAE